MTRFEPGAEYDMQEVEEYAARRSNGQGYRWPSKGIQS